MEKKLTIVLVHGAWGDGAHWKKVIPALVARGYATRAVQLSLVNFEEDVQRTKDFVAAVDGPVLLVGHSYGGMVISNAGHGENIKGLVYIAAFGPDEGESVGSLLALRPPTALASIVKPDAQGFLFLDYDDFGKYFCPGTTAEDAMVMSLSQKPFHSSCFAAPSGKPAWKTKPTWYQVSADDQVIQPETLAWFAERMGARKTITLAAGHASMASNGPEVSEFIMEAADSLSKEI